MEEISDEIGIRIENPYEVGYEGDGRTLKPGATFAKGMFSDTIEELVKDQVD